MSMAHDVQVQNFEAMVDEICVRTEIVGVKDIQ